MKKIVIRKGKRRFKSDEQILAKIDDCYVRAKEMRLKAEKKDTTATEMLAELTEQSTDQQRYGSLANARNLRLEANLLREKATRLVEVRAKLLGERLSELRTGLIPGTGITDTSIPAL